MSKDSSIAQFAWVLQLLAEAVPTQPIHQNSLFQVVQKLELSLPDGLMWMAVYDLRALLQYLVETCWDIWPQTLTSLHVYIFILCFCLMSFCFWRCQRLRFTRRTWRKARSAPDGWPMWVKLQTPALELFETMQPFQDEDDYDVAKAWGISVPRCNYTIIFKLLHKC